MYSTNKICCNIFFPVQTELHTREIEVWYLMLTAESKIGSALNAKYWLHGLSPSLSSESTQAKNAKLILLFY